MIEAPGPGGGFFFGLWNLKRVFGSGLVYSGAGKNLIKWGEDPERECLLW